MTRALKRRRLPLDLKPAFGHVAVGLMLALVLVAPEVRRGLSDPHQDDAWRSEAYNRLIDDLILPRGWLHVSRRNGEFVVQDSCLAPRDGQALEQWSAFKENSYLKRDLNDIRLWITDAQASLSDICPQSAASAPVRLVQIDPAAHQILSPDNPLRAWRNEITFFDRQARMTVLASEAGREMVFSPPGGPAPRYGAIDLFGTGEAEVEGGDYARAYRIRAGGVVVASVLPLSETDALVTVPSTGDDDIQVSVNGRPAPSVRETAQVLLLPAGGSLVFSAIATGRTERFVFRRGGATISTLATTDGERRRYPGLEIVARDVEGAVQDLDRDVATSLDFSLQRAAEDALASQADRLDQGDFRAAVTIMNARDGRVLALGTYPVESLDRQSVTQNHLRRRLAQRNHNFELMPIGSVAKVLFSAALLRQQPQLASLVVQSSGQGFRTLLGVDLGESRRAQRPTVSDTVTSGAVTFADFIARSSNKYAYALMLLGLEETPQPDPRTPRIDDCWRYTAQAQGASVLNCQTLQTDILLNQPRGEYGVRPNMAVFGTGRNGPPWTHHLSSLFDVATEWRTQRPAPDPAIWRRSNVDLSRIRATAVERENLGLNVVRDLRTDYLMTILGGGRSRWSTIRMAEGAARIVTERRIQATLAAEPAGEGDDLEIPPGVWSPLRHGMRRVLDRAARGTGASIPTPDLEGADVRIFAKTGTANLELSVEGSRNEGLAALAAYRCGLTWDGEAGRLMLRGASLRQILGLRENGMKPVCGRLVRRFGMETIIQDADRLTVGRPAPAPANLTVDANDRVLDVAPDSTMEEAFGHAVVLVIGRYASSSTPDQSPERALSIAINFGRRTQAVRHPATDAAAALMRDPRVLAWLKQEN